MTVAHILLSTYNGAPFVERLLDSLLQQTYPAVSILIREDGSSDATPSIVARYAADPRVRVVQGDHVGAATSFFDLLARADAGGYVAFCDQDDVWLPDKISRAVEWLGAQPADVPALYCSRQIVVDEALSRIGLSRALRRGASFGNALVENIAAGCTIVVNDAARARLIGRRPGDGIMHDSWAYLVVAAFGRVMFDDRPGILYRQHAGNAVGSRSDSWGGWGKRFARLWRRDYQAMMLRQAREFDRLFGDELGAAHARVLRRFIDHRRTWRTSLAYALRPGVCRQTALDDAVMRVLIGLRSI